MANHVTLNVNDNAGYSAEQVSGDAISLRDLLEAVQAAISDHGDDAKVVLNNGQRYGAAWGNISQWGDIFIEEEVDEDDESQGTNW